jgi:hypothetical protein
MWMTTPTLRRTVRLTARSSALMFAGSVLATAAGGHAAKTAARPLYLGFLLAHATHFAVVAHYGVRTGGRDLFPGGRSLQDVGGWPSVLSIYSLFASLAFAGWSVSGGAARGPLRSVGLGATGVIGVLFAGTYVSAAVQRRPGHGPAAGSRPALGSATQPSV